MATIERPRERMLRTGTEALGDEELLAILLGSGVRAHPVHKVAKSLITSVGGVGVLSRASMRELAQVTGLGKARAASIVAAFELGRRATSSVNHRPTVGRAEDVFDLVSTRVANLAQEVFIVIGVDIRNGLLEVVEVARGTVAGVEVHPREVFRPLVKMAAAGGVLVHNHPSGEPTPSLDDIALTRRMRDAGALIGIPIIDHVVIGDRAYRSIAEHLGTEF